MSEVIVVTSGKGGVGKTTTTANVGNALARLGFSVLLIDTDIGLRNLDVVMGLENRVVYNLMDVVEGNCKPKQAILKDRYSDNLFMLPAAQTKDKTDLVPEQMKKLIKQLKYDYDYIILDCPAGIEHGFKNAVYCAERALIVTTPDVSAIRDADRIIGILNSIEMPRIDLIVNKVRHNMVKRGDMMDAYDVADILAINLIGYIEDEEIISVSSNRGESIFDTRSKVKRAYDNIALNITGKGMLSEEKQSLFNWLKKKDKDVHKIQSQRL